MNKLISSCIGVLVAGSLLCGCRTAEEEFIADRLLDLCNEAYLICNMPANCTIEEDVYIEGQFPGTRRVVVPTEQEDTTIRVRIYFKTMESPGTEMLLRAMEPNCTIDRTHAMKHLQDIDLFDEAGDDRQLIFELTVSQIGEHLLELYSDATAEYYLIIDLISA